MAKDKKPQQPPAPTKKTTPPAPQTKTPISPLDIDEVDISEVLEKKISA